MKKNAIVRIAVLIGVGVLVAPFPALADTGKLIGSLTDLLGVSREQATGGAGAVLREAKNNMSGSDYSSLLKAIPGIDSLISAAPKTGGMAGSASSMLGGASGSLKGVSALADSFGKLGLAPDMVNKYVDVILNYVQSEGGQQAMTLMKNALL